MSQCSSCYNADRLINKWYKSACIASTIHQYSTSGRNKAGLSKSQTPTGQTCLCLPTATLQVGRHFTNLQDKHRVSKGYKLWNILGSPSCFYNSQQIRDQNCIRSLYLSSFEVIPSSVLLSLYPRSHLSTRTPCRPGEGLCSPRGACSTTLSVLHFHRAWD